MKRSHRLSRRPGPSCRKVHPSSSSVPSASLQPWRPGRAASFVPSPRPCESHLRRPQPPSARPVCAVCQGWVTKCHRPSGSPRRAFPWSGRLDVAVRASAGQTSPEAAPPGPPLAASGRLFTGSCFCAPPRSWLVRTQIGVQPTPQPLIDIIISLEGLPPSHLRC